MAVTSGLYIGFGLVSRSLAPLVSDISNDLDLSRSQMGSVLGAWQFMYLGAAIPAGKFLDRVGLRNGLLVGILLITASGFLRVGASGWFTLAAAVGVFGLGGPLVSIGAPTLVSAWFPPEERGLATGIAVTGPVFGFMFSLLTANAIFMPLFDQQWRWVVAVYAAISAILGLAFLIVTARPPATIESPWHRSVAGRVPNRALLSVPIVRRILVLAIFTFFVNHAIANWLPEILRDHGLTAANASFWAAMVSVPGVAAGILLPRLAKPERRRLLLVGFYLVLAVGLLPVAFSWGPASAVGILSYGAMRSAVLPVAMLFLMDHKDVGPANMAGAAALYFTAGEIGGVSGPVVVGLLADQGSFRPAVLLLVAIGAGLAALGFRLERSVPATSSQNSS